MATVVVLALLGGACGGSSTPTSERSAAKDDASLLAFTSPAIGGGTVDGAAFKGRPTLLWFWSPW